ncbi:MAG TPA: DUF4350 domain-containing protein, partial [Acidimicrobiales bacterium]
MTAPASAPRSWLRTWAPWLVIAAAVLGIAFIFGPRPDNGVPLDPSSPKPLGTKAVVETLRELGAEVSIDSTAPGPQTDTALLLVDSLTADHRQAVDSWVRAGGTLVLTDPASPLSPAEARGTAEVAFVDPDLLKSCDLPALRGANRAIAPGALLMRVPAGSTGCFRRGRDAWLVVSPAGQGTVVTIGGPGFLTNGQLGKADNAAVIAALLAPGRATRVSMLKPPPPGGGSESLTDLIPDRVKLAILQL